MIGGAVVIRARLDVLSLAPRLARLSESFCKWIVVDFQLRDLVILRSKRERRGRRISIIISH